MKRTMAILVMVCCVLAAGTAVMAFPATFYTWTLSNTTHVDGVSAWFADPGAQYDGKWSNVGGYLLQPGLLDGEHSEDSDDYRRPQRDIVF